MLVLGIRPEGASRLPPSLAGASRIGEWITLSSLTVSAVRDLSEALGTPKLSWHAASRVQAHTNGNPLHLRTLLNEVPVDVLEDVTRPIPAPASLGQLVVNELSRLSPGAQRVAAAAAVLGERPLVNALVTVAGVAVEEARDACEELTSAGMLRGAPGGARAEFTHPAMRSAFYDDLWPTARAILHTRAARISTGAEAVQHRVQAAFGPDPALAAELERDAQDSAVHGRLLTGARALLQAARLSPPGEDADRRLLAGVEALLMSGDVGAARAQAPALETLPRTGRRLAVEARIAWLSGDATRAIRLGREAWTLGDGLDEQALGALAGLLAHIELLCDNGDEAARWSMQALARERLDPAATSHIRAVHCIALGARGRSEERR